MPLFSAIVNVDPTFVDVYIAMLRYIIPAISLLLLFRCIKPLISFRREPEIWAWLHLSPKKKIPITHWENVIGRSKRSDIVIDFQRFPGIMPF